MDYADTLVQLGLLINDSLLQLSTDQKEQALTAAWNDSWVSNQVWDSTLTFSTSTYQYPIPVAVTSVNAVYLKRSSDDMPEEISAELWEVVGDNLQFNAHAKASIPDGYTLYIRGTYKLSTSDTLDTPELQNYVLANAGYLTLRNLGYTKIFSFLRNDTSLAEIIGMRNAMYQDMVRYRQQLQRQYEAN